MGLNGQCPICGVRGPLAIFLVVMESKQAMAIIAELPREVSLIALHYLDLFRPTSGQAIGANKAMRLLTDLRGLLASGYVQYKTKVARPCPPRIWAEAIQTMLDQRASLELPMANHKYLIKVAWGKADAEDSCHEADVRKDEACGQVRKIEEAHGELPWEKHFKPGNLLKGVE